MPTTYRPTPTHEFSYDALTKTFSAEMSAISGSLHNEDPLAPLEITLIGRSGREVRFTVTETVRDGDDDVLFWALRSGPHGVFSMVLYND